MSPTVPTMSIDQENAAGYVKNKFLTVNGTADIGITVYVYEGDNLLGTGMTDGDGAYSITLTTALIDGSHTISVMQDQDSKLSASHGVIVDTVVPTLTASESILGLTSNTSDVISGTVNDSGGVQGVEVFDGSTDLGAATITDGGWTYTASGLKDGIHNFSVIATDIAGNIKLVAFPSALNVIVDTTSPIVTISSQGVLTNTPSQTITGTVDDLHVGTTVAVYDNDGGVAVGNAIVEEDGSWSVDVILDGDGDHHLFAKSSDAVGNVGVSTTILDTLDTLAPTLVVMESVSGITNQTTQVITITPDDAHGVNGVQIFDEGNFIGSATDNDDGTWAFSTTISNEGTHDFTAVATDQAGNSSLAMSAGDTVTFDKTPPVVTITSLGGVSGSVLQTITGTATDLHVGATISIYDGDDRDAIGSANVGSDGLWSSGVILTGDGDHVLTAKDTDTAGNVGSAIVTVTLDTTPPTGCASEQFTGLIGQTGDIITILTEDMYGIQSVEVFDGSNSLGAATDNLDGSWTFSATGLSNGDHNFTAVATDTAGNKSAPMSAGDTVTVDTTGPTITVGPYDALTNGLSETISGTAIDPHGASSVQIYDDAKNLVADSDVDKDGNWTATVPFSNDEGQYNFVVQSTDSLGNIGQFSNVTITYDITAPTLTVTESIAGLTKSSSDVISGTMNDLNGVIGVEVYDNGIDLGAAGITGNTWTYTASGLTEGNHGFAAVATDKAGNSSDPSSAGKDVIVDKTMPTLTAAQSIGGLTNQTSDTISGTVSDSNGVRGVEIYDGSSDIGAASIDGDGNWTYTASGLTDGTHTFTAIATDNAGNIKLATFAADPNGTVEVDATGPAVTITPGVGLTNNGSQTISGTASDPHHAGNVSIYDNGSIIQTAIVGEDGTWSANITLNDDGQHNLQAESIDDLGNVGDSIVVTDILDTTPPFLMFGESIAGPTNSTSDVISGIVCDQNGVQGVEVFDGDTDLGAATIDENGNWTYTAAGLSDGSHSFSVIATDLAGNSTGQTSAGDSILVDATPPVVTIASLGVLTNNAYQTISGTATDLHVGSMVSIYDNGGDVAVATAIVGEDGSWTTSVVLNGEGIHSLVAQNTDAFYNTGSSAAVIDTLDTVAPTLTVTKSITGLTNRTHDVISGTLNDLNGVRGVEVYDGKIDLGAATITGNTWTYTATGLTEGTHSFAAMATDNAGNTSGGANHLESVAIVKGNFYTEDLYHQLLAAGIHVTEITSYTAQTLANFTSVIVYGNDYTDTDALTTYVANGGNLVLTPWAGSNYDIPSALQVFTNGGDGDYGSSHTVAVLQPANALLSDVNFPAGTVTVGLLTGITFVDGDTQIANWSDGTPFLAEKTYGAGTVIGVNMHVITSDSGYAIIDQAWAAQLLDNAVRQAHVPTSAGPDVIVDTTAPTLTLVESVSGITNQTSNVISGTVTDLNGVQGVEVYDNFVDVGAATITGNTWSYTATDLADGLHNFAAIATDNAQNIKFATLVGSSETAMVVDTVAPVVTITSTGVLTNAASQTISGTATDLHVGGTVSIYDNDSLTTLATATVGTDGKWSTTVALSGDGPHRLMAQNTDAAGNTGSSATVTDTLDTVLPVLTVAESILGLTRQTADVISGTVSDLNGVRGIEIYDGLTDLGAATISGNTWTYTASGLVDGSHTFSAIATDMAGNSTGKKSAGGAVVVDTVATVVAITSAAVLTKIASQTISGTASDLHIGSTVSIYDNANVAAIATATIGIDGKWSTNVVLGADGSHSLIASSTDAAGNTGSSKAVTDTLDTVAPVVAITSTTHLANVASQTISGTATDLHVGGTVSIYDNGSTAVLGSATVNSNGTWSTSVMLADSRAHSLVARNTDLAGNVGNSSAQVIAAGAGNDPLMDSSYYLTANPDVAASGMNATTHYNTYGWQEGRNPDAFFSTVGYLGANPGVAHAGTNPLLDYETNGWKMDHDPSANFDVRLYLLHNPDVAAAGIDPLQHYLQYGQYEGRTTYAAIGPQDLTLPGFDAEYYELSNPDVAKSGMDPLLHFETYGWKEGRMPDAVFDVKFYQAQNPDVAASGMDPLLHYDTYGWKEGRNPSSGFSTTGYLAHNPDVAAAGVNPMQHYLTSGIFEGRAPV